MNKKSILKSCRDFCLSSFLLLCSCSYSIKEWEEDYKFVNAENPSWDSGIQNSGLISYDPNYGFKISKYSAKRYKDLTILYGKNNIPVIKPGEGLKTVKGEQYIQNQYLTIFILFNQKYKRGD